MRNIRRERKGWLVRVQVNGKRMTEWIGDDQYEGSSARSLARALMARDKLEGLAWYQKKVEAA